MEKIPKLRKQNFLSNRSKSPSAMSISFYSKTRSSRPGPVFINWMVLLNFSRLPLTPAWAPKTARASG
jgi:hypothetical protein